MRHCFLSFPFFVLLANGSDCMILQIFLNLTLEAQDAFDSAIPCPEQETDEEQEQKTVANEVLSCMCRVHVDLQRPSVDATVTADADLDMVVLPLSYTASALS